MKIYGNHSLLMRLEAAGLFEDTPQLDEVSDIGTGREWFYDPVLLRQAETQNRKLISAVAKALSEFENEGKDEIKKADSVASLAHLAGKLGLPFILSKELFEKIGAAIPLKKERGELLGIEIPEKVLKEVHKGYNSKFGLRVEPAAEEIEEAEGEQEAPAEEVTEEKPAMDKKEQEIYDAVIALKRVNNKERVASVISGNHKGFKNIEDIEELIKAEGIEKIGPKTIEKLAVILGVSIEEPEGRALKILGRRGAKYEEALKAAKDMEAEWKTEAENAAINSYTIETKDKRGKYR